MHRDDVPITTPCGADWTEMTPVEARARLCASCNKVVHDLSAMDAASVRRKLADGPTCVRYLYDEHGRILFGPAPRGARLVPAGMLLSKRLLASAALAGTALVFEACGGADGGSYRTSDIADASTTPTPRRAPTASPDAGPNEPERMPAAPEVGEDAGEPDAGEPDGGP